MRNDLVKIELNQFCNEQLSMIQKMKKENSGLLKKEGEKNGLQIESDQFLIAWMIFEMNSKLM